MKTLKIQMSKVKNKTVFEGCVWKEATREEEVKALEVLSKLKLQ